MKKVTRRQAQAWLFPLRNLLNELATGEIAAVQGYAISQVGRVQSDTVRADHLVVGFACMVERVAPNLDVSPLVKLAKKLESGVLLTQYDLVQCRNTTRSVEVVLTGMPMRKVKSLALTEQISIELERNHHG